MLFVAWLSAFGFAGTSPGIWDYFFLSRRSLSSRRSGIRSIMIIDSLGMSETILKLLYDGIFFGNGFLILFFLRSLCFAKTVSFITERGYLLLVSENTILQLGNLSCGFVKIASDGLVTIEPFSLFSITSMLSVS